MNAKVRNFEIYMQIQKAKHTPPSLERKFGGGYAIYAFDGAKFYLIKQETNKNFKITVKLDEPISSSYQIKIVADQGIMEEPDFIVI